MQEEFKVVREEFKAVRSDIAVLSERLTRVETLLERDADQADSAVAPETRP